MSKSPDARRELRRVLLAEREALSGVARQKADHALRAVLFDTVNALLGARLATSVIGGFWPVRGEPDLRELFALWPQVALPVVVAREAPLGFRRWTPGASMHPGEFGIPVPVRGESVAPDVLIVPCLGFFCDFAGRIYRLGYGGGLYDRTLAGTPCPTIGVAYDSARLQGQEPRAHDVALDQLVTPSGRL